MAGESNSREDLSAGQKEQESSLCNALMDSASGLLVTDTEGFVLWANPAAKTILGCEQGKPIGANTEMLSPGHEPIKVDVTKADGSTIPVEFCIRDTRWCERPAFCISVRDLGEWTAAEEALRQERDFSSRLINTAQAIVLLLDGDGHIINFNPYMEKLCGVPLAEARGKDWFGTFLPERMREKTRTLFQNAIGGMSTHGNIDVLLTRDGEERVIQWYDSTLRDENGKATELLAIGHDVTARVLAEQEREEAATRLAAALKAADVGLWDYYPQENRAHYSDEWKRQLGYEPGEIIDDPEEWAGRLHRDDHDRALKVLSDYVLTGAQGEYSVEFRLRHKDGSYRWMLSRGAAVEQKEGLVTRMLGCHVDITERKLAESRLQESERLLNETQHLVRLGAWELDVVSGKAIWSDELYRIYGVDRDFDASDWNQILSFTREDDRTRLLETLEKCIDHQVPFDIEYRFRDAAGRDLWCRDTGEPVIRDGAVVGVRGILQDITKQKQAEERIEWLSRFPSENPNPVLRFSGNGTVHYANEASETLLRFLTVPVSNQLLPEWQEHVAACLSKNQAETLEIDTGEQVFRTTLMPIGKYGYVNAYASDVTELLKMEAQLRQAQKLESIGQLAGGVAHDFNNLLMGIMNYLRLCRDKVGPDHPIRQWLDEIANDAKRSADLTRQLLAFARKQTITPKVLDLNDTVAGMLKLLRRLIGEDVELNWVPGANVWPVKLDPSQIDQILANLCVNARDAIGGIGKVTIETRNIVLDEAYCAKYPEAQPGPHVVLEIRDTGHGMDRKTLEHIFEPFFTTKEVGRGTGLGLSTVHGIVRQNGGHITVDSEPGRGTTFCIYLPRFEGRIEQTSPHDTSAMPCGGTETILVVEDEKSVRVTIHMFLQALGYTVLTAIAPDEALCLAEEDGRNIDLLITDVIMPVMTGRDLADRLRKIFPNLRCLFMSGYTADVIAPSGVLDNDLDFLPKPFGRSQLAVKVREVLNRDRDSEP